MMKLLVLAVLLGLACTVASEGLRNTKLKRNIDLTSQLARHTLAFSVVNKGTSDESSYTLALEDKYYGSKVAFLKAYVEDVELKITKGSASQHNKQSYTTYKIEFAKPLAAAATAVLKINIVLTRALAPFPTHIAQGDRQLVRYFDNHFFFTPYLTDSQTTTVKLASTQLVQHTESAPTTVKGNTVTYGPYSDVKPFSSSELIVHFENNSPFLTINRMVKDYEVSHWGQLAVEQSVDFQHDGATLKGSFSRFDFQRNPSGSPSAILEIVETLPQGAADVYYRDDIGNISTSSFSSSKDSELQLRLVPRFPLFGGWKNNFYTGYNLPLEYYLFTASDDSSHHVLNVSFSSDLGNAFVDHLTVKIILPEGASNYRVEIPFAVDSQSESKHYTYLDTTGRPVLIIEKRNVVPEHNQPILVHYTSGRLSLLHEPLLVVGAFFLFFLAIMFFVRFELAIQSTSAASNKELDVKISQFIAKYKVEVQHRLDTLLSADAKKVVSNTVSTVVSEAQVINSALHQKVVEIEDYAKQLSDVVAKYAKVEAEIVADKSKKLERQLRDNLSDLKSQKNHLLDRLQSAKEDLFGSS